MRTLSTQVRLRRLIRSFGEAVDRLRSEPQELQRAGSVVARLLELSEHVRNAWLHEDGFGPAVPAIERYVYDSLRQIELAIAGLQQEGADLELLRGDFEVVALPLEVFMRGLDGEPALQRSA
jgi:hypothetical protein